MNKVIISLALGTFGLGMAEFGIMAILTELAHDRHLPVSSAGHMISFYALGVVIGAPVIAVVSSQFSLKRIMIFLATLCIIGNAAFGFASSYPTLVIARLVSGFPHGAFFGVGAIILTRVISPGKVTAAVAGMVSGMTLANLIGIPLGTFLSHEFSWRSTFLLIAEFNIAVMAAIICWIPDISDRAPVKISEQFHFLKSAAPWLIFLATLCSNAGVFAWFSYIKPVMIYVSGFSESTMPLIMMLAGLGMVLGNMVSGKISGRFSPLRIAAMTNLTIAAALALTLFFAYQQSAALSLAFITCAGLFALSAPLQILLLQNAKGGEMLGAAGGQIAFNLGSAVGAFCGGMMLDAGLPYNYVALPAALLSLSAMLSLLCYGRVKSRSALRSAAGAMG
ncbi:MAG: MFS transporter AraJ [Pantoea sp.]|nr:MFS transporter AraJ [Pantoea sp.]